MPNFNTKYAHISNPDILKHEYGNGRVAIVIQGNDPDDRIVATVNAPHLPCGKGNVHIKDYSENEGVLAECIKWGIISQPVTTHQSGFVTIYECELLI